MSIIDQQKSLFPKYFHFYVQHRSTKLKMSLFFIKFTFLRPTQINGNCIVPFPKYLCYDQHRLFLSLFPTQVYKYNNKIVPCVVGATAQFWRNHVFRVSDIKTHIQAHIINFQAYQSAFFLGLSGILHLKSTLLDSNIQYMVLGGYWIDFEKSRFEFVEHTGSYYQFSSIPKCLFLVCLDQSWLLL